MSNGETCDSGSDNGTAGNCNSACTSTVPVVTTCNSITATPVSGTAPLDVSVSCNATNASTYRIDCGNGTTHLSSAGVCRYVAGGTYAPVCTVNTDITSPSCTTSVTVNPPLPAPVCSPTIRGSVDFPLSSVTPSLCSIGSVATFGATVVGSTTNYAWSCNNAGQAAACTANYTPPPVPADLALKKYVNTVDAQDNASAVNIQSGTSYVYTVTVQNIGTGILIASRTTVSDPLPAGVTLTGLPSGTGWSCSGATGATSFTCVRDDGLAAGSFFSTITVPVTVMSQPTYLTNTATVNNAMIHRRATILIQQ